MRGFAERPSESKRLVLTSLPHQLQPAVWLGRNPHRRLFKATKHKLGVSEVVQGRKCKAPAFPVGVAPADWLFRVPCGWRCHSEFHSKRHTCHSPEAHGPAGGGGGEQGWNLDGRASVVSSCWSELQHQILLAGHWSKTARCHHTELARSFYFCPLLLLKQSEPPHSPQHTQICILSWWGADTRH